MTIRYIRSRSSGRRRSGHSFWPRALLTVSATLTAATATNAQTDQPLALTGAIVNTFARGDYEVAHYWGWSASVSGNITRSLSLVGEGSAEYLHGTFDSSFAIYTLMGGPRFAQSIGRTRAYAEFPVGLLRFSTTYRLAGQTDSYAYNFFAFKPGGGVDIDMTRHLAIRLGADYPVPKFWDWEAWGYPVLTLVTGLTYRP